MTKFGGGRHSYFVIRTSYFQDVVLKARPHVFLGGVVLHGRYPSAHIGKLLGPLAVRIGCFRTELRHYVAVRAKAGSGFRHRSVA